jgi:hypothetical protein
MLKQQLPNIYSEALHYLTTGGTAAAAIIMMGKYLQLRRAVGKAIRQVLQDLQRGLTL